MKEKFIPKSFYLQWHITERCNWRCKHCYQESYKTPEMSLEQLYGVLDQYLALIKKWNIPKSRARMSLTGGEPLIRSDFFSLLARMHKFGNFFNYTILSNGSLIDKEIIKKLKFLGVNNFQVSLEGMEKNNDEIRGKGSFLKVINSIKLLLDNKILNIRVSLSLNKKNAGDVEKLADFLTPIAKGKGNITLAARRMVPWGSASEMKEFIQEPLELKNFYESVERINKRMTEKKCNVRVVGGCENGIFNGLVSNNLMSISHCGIVDGRLIIVMPNGDVLPCRRLPIKAGNVLKQSLEEIYYSDFMEKLRSKNNKHKQCKNCDNYQNCFGGAPCVTYAYTGKINIPDVQCWRAYDNLEEVRNNKYSEEL
ncbi:MAG: radical SAM protein [Patescibacteria group bacterium]